jgi:carbon-monoxide dehydrogenase medium subunit
MKRGGKQARFVAGGTDLLLQSDPAVKVLVDVTRLKLNYIRPDKDGLVIGAATTLATLESATPVQRMAGGILALVARVSAPLQIRNRATIGGILATASPAADILPALLALDASVVMAEGKGRRRMPLREFFRGPRQTALNGSLITEILVPAPPPGPSAWAFRKLARLDRDLPIANAVAGLGIDKQGRTKWARLALGSLGPTVLRMDAAEQLLEGQPLTAALLDQATVLVDNEVHPVDDVRASAAYRRAMSRVLARRALADCVAQLGRTL